MAKKKPKREPSRFGWVWILALIAVPSGLFAWWRGDLPMPVALQDVSTASEWFVLEAEVQVDGLPFRYAAVIRRHPRQVETVIRLRGQW